jgi:hypothetical protein
MKFHLVILSNKNLNHKGKYLLKYRELSFSSIRNFAQNVVSFAKSLSLSVATSQIYTSMLVKSHVSLIVIEPNGLLPCKVK